MLLAELKFEVRGEFEEYEKNKDKLDEALGKLENYAIRLFEQEWAKEMKLEVED